MSFPGWFRNAAAVALGTATAGCSLDGPNGHGVVHVESASVAPADVNCIGGAVDFEFRMELVNTTSDTVVVNRVETSATVVQSAPQDLTGKLTYQVNSLPFGTVPTEFETAPPFPGPVVLQPRDGDRKMKATMHTACLPGVPRSGGGTANVYLTLYVWTSVGLYTSKVLTIRHSF